MKVEVIDAPHPIFGLPYQWRLLDFRGNLKALGHAVSREQAAARAAGALGNNKTLDSTTE